MRHLRLYCQEIGIKTGDPGGSHSNSPTLLAWRYSLDPYCQCRPFGRLIDHLETRVATTTVIVVTLLTYKLLLIAIGLWASRRTQSDTGFFLGDRQLGPWVAAISYSASACSAWTLLGLSGAAFVLGISVLWLILGALLGMVAAWMVLAKPVQLASKVNNLLTLSDFLTLDVEGAARWRLTQSVAFVILFCFIFYIAAQFQGAGTAFASVFDLAATNAILIGAAIVLVYTWLGGFWAVSVTDTIQGLVMVLAAVILPLATLQVVGGPEALWAGLAQVSTPEQMSLTGNAPWLTAAGIVAGGLATGLSTFGQPHLLVRFMALRDDKARLQATIITSVWYVLVWFGMAILGLMGRLLMPEIADPEQIFFALAEDVLPPVMAGILMAAVISAIMSTADSQLLVSASVLAHDLGLSKRLPAYRVLIGRAAVAAVVIAASLIALYLPSQIFNRVLFAWVALGAAFGPMVIVRVLHWKIAENHWIIGLWLGFGSAVLLSLLPSAPGDVVERMLPFVLHLGFLTLVRKR